jgi:hypothetical protein
MQRSRTASYIEHAGNVVDVPRHDPEDVETHAYPSAPRAVQLIHLLASNAAGMGRAAFVPPSFPAFSMRASAPRIQWSTQRLEISSTQTLFTRHPAATRLRRTRRVYGRSPRYLPAMRKRLGNLGSPFSLRVNAAGMGRACPVQPTFPSFLLCLYAPRISWSTHRLEISSMHTLIVCAAQHATHPSKKRRECGQCPSAWFR